MSVVSIPKKVSPIKKKPLIKLNNLKTLGQGDLKNLPAGDLRWLAGHYCPHRKPYLTHPSCFVGKKEPKILYFDLETTAHEGFFWGRTFQTDIIKTTHYGKILSYAAKWDDQKTFFRGWLDTNERGLVKELWKLFDEADFICAHNLRQFDHKWVLTKFALYNLSPPSPYKLIDTKIEAKKYLKLPSYSLNNIADYFKLGHKVEHEGFSLWERCIKKDKKAWKKMREYNLFDVELLYKVYKKLEPFR